MSKLKDFESRRNFRNLLTYILYIFYKFKIQTQSENRIKLNTHTLQICSYFRLFLDHRRLQCYHCSWVKLSALGSTKQLHVLSTDVLVGLLLHVANELLWIDCNMLNRSTVSILLHAVAEVLLGLLLNVVADVLVDLLLHVELKYRESTAACCS
jgi:hypothetical protein